VWALDAFDFILITFVLSDIARAFGVAVSQVSLLILATFGVRWAGGLLFGSLSDRIGRKVPLLIALGWFSLGCALTGLAWNFASILAFRLFLGFGMAPIFALGSTMIAENWSPRHRAIGIGLLDAGWGVGTILAALVYAVVYPHFGWRALFFVGAVPGALLLIILYRFFPDLTDGQAGPQEAGKGWAAVRLFTEHPAIVLVLALLLFFGQFAAWPLQGLLPTLLRDIHFDAAQISWITSISAIGQIFGFASAGFAINALGRRKGVALLLLLGGASVFLMVQALPNILLASVLAFTSGFFVVGAGGCFATIAAENLPAHVRGSGVGFLYNIGVFGGGVAPYIVLSSIRRLDISVGQGIALFTILAALIGGLISLTLLRETKDISLQH